jgi:hypothetical protein
MLLPAYGERVLITKNNKISIACTLTTLNTKVFQPNNINATYFGSYLFSRRVSGVRVVNSSFGKQATIGNTKLTNYGSNSETYPHLPYFTCAASIGQERSEIEVFIHRLREAFEHFSKGDPVKIFKVNAALVKEHKVEKKEEEKDEVKEDTN